MIQINIFSTRFIWETSKKYFLFLFVAVTFLVYGFLFTSVHAESITKNYLVTSGVDTSTGEQSVFTENEIGRISASDDATRLTSEASWPKNNQYDENKYLEFIFNPDIPSDAVIESVILNNEFRRSGALSDVKMEVWNGTEFINYPLTKGTIGQDHTDTLDLTSILNTPDLINSLKIRFLAYRDEGADVTTGHDFVGLSVTYSIPEVVINPPTEPVIFTEINSDITENTTWTKEGSPYVITSSIFVNKGSTLHIEPGVIVKLESGVSLIVDGVLDAEGIVDNEIYFTSSNDDSLGGDTNGDQDESYPSENDWDYILIENPELQSTLNYVVSEYSRSGLVLYNGASVDSNSFNSDKGIEAFGSKSTFVNLNILYINLYDKSSFLVDDSVISNENGSVMNVESESHLDLKNSKVGGFNNYAISIYGNSLAVFDNVEITGYLAHGSIVSVFSDSNLEINNSSIISNDSGFVVFNNSILSIKDSHINCLNNGIEAYNNSTLNLSGVEVSGLNDGLYMFNEVTADINNTKITGFMDAGITAFSNTSASKISVTKSEITENNYGFMVWNSNISVHKSNIHDNFSYGVLTFRTSSNPIPIDLDFVSNYWGDPYGPTHASNPTGNGDMISDNVLYAPFLKTDPLKNTRNPVILIPGITGSYLIKDYGDKGEIWPDIGKLMSPLSLSDSFLNDLVLNEDGTQKSEFPIIPGDIIRNMLTVHVFDNLISKLEEEGYVEGTDLFVFPYDWRLNTKGTSQLLKEKIDKILADTGQEKVDIVAHSMGGLVAKKYIADNGKDKVDQLIFLGTPQLGSPKAFNTLMFGNNMGYKFLILSLNKLRAKFISQNMPSVYELLPSNKYIQDVGNYITNALDKNNPLNLDYTDTKNFLVNEGRNQLMFPFAEELHDSIDYLDLSDIKSYNFAGCALPTIGKITVKKEKSWLGKILGEKEDYEIGYTTGDETVPLVSASKTIGSDIYYAYDVSHSALPASESIIKGIVSILKNEGITFDNTLQDNNSNCKISGDVVSTHSPVELHVYDEFGNHTGPNENGDIEYGIPGVQYDVLDDVNYVFLPDGKDYRIVTKATDTGGFNLKIEEQSIDDVITKTHDWTLVPIESLLSTSEIWIGPDYTSDSYKLEVDNDGNGSIDENYEEGFDGTSIAEKLTKEEDKKEKTRNSAVGSYITKKEKNENLGGDNFVDNVKIPKLSDYKREDSKTNNQNKNQEVVKESNTIKDIQKQKDKNKDMKNNLLASAGSIDGINNRTKLQLIIVGAFALLLLGLKFIFKVL